MQKTFPSACERCLSAAVLLTTESCPCIYCNPQQLGLKEQECWRGRVLIYLRKI